MSELVSVIVPVYNIESYLPRCLACLKAQTYTDLEIILVDDGSTDGTGRLCDEFAASDPRARVIHHPENRGLWAARNTGQDAATGEYLWFPDGDDYFHKDIVKWMYEAINQTSSSGKKYDLAIVGHRRTSRFDGDVTSDITPSFFEVSLEDVLEVFVRPKANFTGRNVWNKLCRKELISDIRTGNYQYAQDCDFSLKVYLKSPRVICVEKVLYFFVNRTSSVRFSQDYALFSNLCVTKIIYDNYCSHHMKPEWHDKYLLSDLYTRMAILLDQAQNKTILPEIKRECRRTIRYTWFSYLTCKEISTLKKRCARLLRVCFDGYYRCWVKYTHSDN